MVIRSALLQRLVESRGYTDGFLDGLASAPAGERLLDIDEMCGELKQIHDRGEAIGFIPDFDMDGIMAGTIGLAGLTELGIQVGLYMPNTKGGYGFDEGDIERLVRQFPGMSTVMTADVGVTCTRGIAVARECGLRVLVTDHHIPKRSAEGADILPDADVVVDPMRADDPYPEKHICGAYVLYQVLDRYAELYCDREAQAQIRRLRVFAAIGTVSDSMPVLRGNRALLRDGIAIARMVYNNGNPFILECLSGSDCYVRAFRGLYAALKVFADAGKIASGEDIDEDFFGYYLVPAFNSVRRLDEDISMAFGVFFGPKPEEAMARMLELNERRKELVDEHLRRIQAQDNPMAPFAYETDAPKGIRGLLATKLLRPQAGPCLVLAEEEDGVLRGSGRSPEWFRFLSEAGPGSGCPASAAGHDAAFGVSVRREDMASAHDWIRDKADELRSGLREDQLQVKPDFVIAVDGSGDVDLDLMAFSEFVDEIQYLKPFGPGFPAPQILLRFRRRDGEWAAIGKEKQHLRVRLGRGFEVLCWNQAFRIDDFGEDDTVEAWGSLSMNRYMGRTTVQFIATLD